MTAEIVNLRQVRKSKARDAREKQAEQNRITHGRTKAEKRLTKALNDKAEAAHAAGRLDTPET
ncbi:DUF4169 family protein [Ensifer soli]|uniref:DUF4169 family protein n=1 Tax=Ciceribacter sp. sgz301302 TaxID=3342379 RepID=UPI0035B92F75